MANEELKFKRQVYFDGRNGYFKSIGLLITKLNSEDLIDIYPVTSKGQTARCVIQIPMEEIDNLIENLKLIK